VPRDEALALPERHLGLVPAGEHGALQDFLDGAARRVADAVDVSALLALARPGRLVPSGAPPQPLPPLGQRIAIARDDAFLFLYPAMLDGWRQAGATLSFFSPLADGGPAADADAVFLPGGYPELHAGRLAANTGFFSGLRSAARRGAVVYGECGGYMALGDGLIDASGASHAMAGLLPLVTSFAERRLHLGYRSLTLAEGAPFGAAGSAFRGHEFHYASIIEEGDAPRLFAAADSDGAPLGQVGLRIGRVMGSFLHLVDREGGPT
jgi:cobyrinic acid a,c-diamide synthase